MITMTPALTALIDEVEQLRATRSDAAQVPRVQGELLAAIALACNAKLVVEVGTSYGFSGLWWSAALAITGGHLHTIDISEKKFSSAKQTFAVAGVAERVTNHLGSAHDVLPTISGVVDLAFIDADKPSSARYFEILWPKVRIGGGILTDNINSHREEFVEYVRNLRARPDAHTVTIPIGGGLEWTVKLR